jgi:hypothetical protein
MYKIISESFRESRTKQRESEMKERLSADFAAFDKSSAKKWSDAELAIWQSRYPPDSPHALFAEQQWRYRLSRHSAKYAAVIAIVSALIGAVVGYGLRYVQTEVAKQYTQTEKHQNYPPPVMGKTK